MNKREQGNEIRLSMEFPGGTQNCHQRMTEVSVLPSTTVIQLKINTQRSTLITNWLAY